MERLKQSIITHLQLLQSKIARQTSWGFLITLLLLLIANLIASYAMNGTLTFAGILRAQQTNPALWFLNAMPFLFLLWSRYLSSMIARAVSAMAVSSHVRSQIAETVHDVADQEREEIFIHSSKSDQQDQRCFILLSELQQSTKNNEMTLFYQPGVDIKTGRIAVEALVRWEHPRHGLLSFSDFSSFAERAGFMNVLSNWVFSEVLKQCASWRQDGIDIDVAINVSSFELMGAGLFDKVNELLMQYEIEPSSLVLEVNEDAILKDQELATVVLTRFAEHGVRISIDNFGVGYSSLSYLSKLPATELKIDRSFITNMKENRSDETIVCTTINLAHNLGLKVGANGIEDKETLSQLKRLGCDLVQGFLISPPLGLSDLDHWLRTSIWAGVEHVEAQSLS